MRYAAIALPLLCAAGALQAQPFTCNAGAASTPALRARAQSDLAGVYTLNCAGVRPAGGITGRVTIIVNAPVTSRLLSVTGGASEALLLVDQPQAGAQLAQPAGAFVFGANVIQGTQPSSNTVTFDNVTILPPGPEEPVERVFHVVNIRVNPSTLGPSEPVRITATISANASIGIGSATQTVATAPAAAGIGFAVRASDDSAAFAGQFDGCAGRNAVVTAATTRDFNLKFTENALAAFRVRNVASTPDAPFTVGNQNEPGADYGTESGFVNTGFPATGGMNAAGLATQGTRLMARFSSLPPGVRVWVTVQPVAPGTSQTGIAARLTLADGSGSGGYNEAAATVGPYRELSVFNGTAVAVWEVLDSSRGTAESVSFGVVLSVPPNVASAAQVEVTGLFGPVSASPPDVSSPAPSYLDGGTPVAAGRIASCNTTPTILTSCPLPGATLSAPYSLNLSASGGLPPYTWSLTSGSLPGGLTLAANGTIAGTPPALGTSQFTLRVADSAGNSASRQCSLAVLPAIVISTACPLPDATLGLPYGQAVQATGGAPPYTLSIAGGSLPPGMSVRLGLIAGSPSGSGTYQFLLQMQDSQGALGQKQCSLRVIGPFRLSPLVLSFTAPTGDGPSPPQFVSIASDAIGATWNASALAGDWLIVSPSGGRIPGRVAVSVDASRLVPGNYSGLVTVTSAQQALSVAVDLRVTLAGPPSLAPRPSGFSLAVPRGTARRNLMIDVLNGGAGALAFTASIEYARGQGWLSLAAASGSTPARLRVAVLPSALEPGVYQARVRLRSAEGDALVPVTLAVSRTAGTIELSSGGLHFTAVEGGSAPPTQGVHVLARGAAPLAWQASSTVDQGLPAWLTLNSVSGQAQAAGAVPKAGNGAAREAAGAAFDLPVSVNPAGLAAGRYYGEVLVRPAAADTPPQFLAVTLDVLAQDANPGPLVAPAALLFTGATGGASPTLKSVTIHNVSRTAFLFDAVLDGDARIWSAVIPQDRTLLPGGASRIDVTANTEGLPSGVYPATLNLQSGADETVRTVRLLLIVAPGARANAQPRTAESGARTVNVDCQAGPLRVLPTLYSGGFTAFTGLPMPMEVLVHDGSGAPMSAGAVNVLLESGVTGASSLAHIGSGYWSGTVIAPPQGSATAGMTIAAVDEAGQTGCVEIGGAVLDSGGPAISEGGVVSPGSFRAHAPLPPGGFVGIFGSRLAEGTSVAGSLPLPLSLGVTSARIAGSGSVPLLFAGVVDNYTQVNGVLPYNLPTEAVHTLVLSNRTGRTFAPFLAAPAQPGVFTANRQGFGQAIAVHGANPFLLADAGAPIGIGQVLVLYCEGLGGVEPPVEAGQPAPDTPLRRSVLPVRLTIGGRDAQVLFAGLTPGFAGLYQINAIVPVGVTPGNAVETIVFAGEQASAPVTIAVAR